MQAHVLIGICDHPDAVGGRIKIKSEASAGQSSRGASRGRREAARQIENVEASTWTEGIEVAGAWAEIDADKRFIADGVDRDELGQRAGSSAVEKEQSIPRGEGNNWLCRSGGCQDDRKGED